MFVLAHFLFWEITMNKDEIYMNLTLKLAKKGRGFTGQNPMVGALVVKNGQILGYGYHKKYGSYHAERNALLNCKDKAKGSTLYVNLEPCSHYGKTPPCTDIIIKSGVKRVVIGTKDPNELVCGGGIKKLKENSIDVKVGVLEKKCKKLNEVFFYHIKNKLPFVAMKFAMTLDGKIATCAGISKWITGSKARAHSHYLRSIYGAILVGVNTVISDDPLLNCRLKNGRDPIRIICDTNLRIPLSSKIVKTAKNQLTYIACSSNNEQKINELKKNGVHILNLQKDKGKISIKSLIETIYKLGVDSVLVEGGAEINYSFLDKNFINAVYAYIAPSIVGGKNAKTPIEGKGIINLNDALKLKNEAIKFLGEDILLEYRTIMQ